MSQAFTLCEVEQNNGKNGKPVWIIVKGVVYNVTKFLKDHPGGEDTILDYAGKDATKAFDQVGHSTDAIQDMKQYKIGTVADECLTQLNFKCKKTKSVTTTQPMNNCAIQTENVITESTQRCCTESEKSRKLFCCC